MLLYLSWTLEVVQGRGPRLIEMQQPWTLFWDTVD